MALRITGSTNNVALVDEDGRLAVNLPIVEMGDLVPVPVGTGPGFHALVSESDPGTIVGSRLMIPPETDRDARLRAGVDSLHFFEPFALATLNSAAWSLTAGSAMTTAVIGGTVRINNSATLTSGAFALLSTLRCFALYSSAPIRIVFDLAIQTGAAAGAAAPLSNANTVWEIGLYIASGASAPTDGIFLRMNAAGQLLLVGCFAGTETTSAVPTTGLSPFINHQYEITVLPELTELWIDNVLYATLGKPANTPQRTQSLSLPFSARVYNSGLATNFTSIALGSVCVSTGGYRNRARFYDRIAMSEQGGYQTQSGNTTPTQTALWTNNTVPGTAALSNTAASYATMGGEFLFAAVAGVETDFCLFGFQVPTDVAGGMNRDLLIRGICIRTEAQGAAVGATGCVLQWGLAVGSSAVSLATAEVTTTSSAVKGPRRKAIGMQGFVAAAPVGTEAQMIDCYFGDSPLFAESGSFVQVILRVPVGTLGGGSTFRGTVDIDAQYE